MTSNNMPSVHTMLSRSYLMQNWMQIISNLSLYRHGWLATSINRAPLVKYSWSLHVSLYSWSPGDRMNDLNIIQICMPPILHSLTLVSIGKEKNKSRRYIWTEFTCRDLLCLDYEEKKRLTSERNIKMCYCCVNENFLNENSEKNTIFLRSYSFQR